MSHSAHRSSRFLKVLTVAAIDNNRTVSGSLLTCSNVGRSLAQDKAVSFQFQLASRGIEFQLVTSCAVDILVQCEEIVWVYHTFPLPDRINLASCLLSREVNFA